MTDSQQNNLIFFLKICVFNFDLSLKMVHYGVFFSHKKLRIIKIKLLNLEKDDTSLLLLYDLHQGVCISVLYQYMRGYDMF